MAYPHAYEAMVRRAVRRLPGRDPLRDQVRGEDTVYGQARVMLHAGHLNVDQEPNPDLVATDFAVLLTAVTSILRDAAKSAQQAHIDGGFPALAPPALDQIAQEFVQAVADLIARRVQIGSDVETVPVGLIQQVLRDVADVPAEHGYRPAASGFSEIGALAASSSHPVYYEWVHGYFGEPRQPDPEHEYLSGSIYATPGVLGGRYVGDHPGCTCFNLPKIAVL